MKIGFIISMYDEIDIVKKTIINLKKFDVKIIVIQSDPGKENMVLDSSLCDNYQKMSDIAGGIEKYQEVIKEKKEGKGETVAATALPRNFSKGFTLIQEYDVEYVIAITGDTKITNLNGIKKIVKKMKKNNKIVGATRTIGYTQFDENRKYIRFQHRQITDIMPQFFIAEMKSIKKGLFCNIIKTNKYTTEQSIGDDIVRYCQQNNLKFFDIFYKICNYGYPRFIDGVQYNPEQISRMPVLIENSINWVRYWNGAKINKIITKIFQFVEQKLLKNN